MVMTSCIALLRGINVSGQKAIRMAGLQASLSALGLADVRTYLQSGNVVFSADKADVGRLAAAIRARIAQDFGHDVAVLVMTAAQLDQIANANPLWPKGGGDEKLFHCTFLFEPVAASRACASSASSINACGDLPLACAADAMRALSSSGNFSVVVAAIMAPCKSDTKVTPAYRSVNHLGKAQP